jgi:hypothetical protein
MKAASNGVLEREICCFSRVKNEIARRFSFLDLSGSSDMLIVYQ